MSDHFALNGPMLPPAEGDPNKPAQVVLLLHGVGADGQDLIGLSPYFQQVLPRAVFISPNAPFPFDMAPFGYQWFSLQDLSAQSRWQGTQQAAPILNTFLDQVLALYGLESTDMALIGFSQGTMMALHVGLRRNPPLAGILGYSGMLSGPEHLAEQIKSRPPVRLIHGELDEVLPVAAMPEAVKALKGAGVEVDSFRRPNLGHGIDEEGIRLGMEFLARLFPQEAE